MILNACQQTPQRAEHDQQLRQSLEKTFEHHQSEIILRHHGLSFTAQEYHFDIAVLNEVATGFPVNTPLTHTSLETQRAAIAKAVGENEEQLKC